MDVFFQFSIFNFNSPMTERTEQPPPMNRRAGHRPEWLKIRVPGNLEQLPVAHLMKDLALNTVCQEARFPKIFVFWAGAAAPFMILGELCPRRCMFGGVGRGKPLPADPGEPARVAE